MRYWNQPLTTNMANSFGDNENGIQFPLMTFCEDDFVTKKNDTKGYGFLFQQNICELRYFPFSDGFIMVGMYSSVWRIGRR